MRTLPRFSFRQIITLGLMCLPLAGCDSEPATCGSEDVISNLRGKLIDGLNYEVGVKGYYDGTRAALELLNPQTIGQSGDMMLCNITMKMIHYTDPKTGKRYPAPQEKSLQIPYSFKRIDAMITLVKINQ